MREPLLVETNLLSFLHVVHYSCLVIINTILSSTYVRMCMSWGQCAWLVNKRLFSSHQRLNEEHINGKHLNRASFEQWLVGFTDRDGNFHISHQGTGTSTKWTLGYKLTQSAYNAARRPSGGGNELFFPYSSAARDILSHFLSVQRAFTYPRSFISAFIFAFVPAFVLAFVFGFVFVINLNNYCFTIYCSSYYSEVIPEIFNNFLTVDVMRKEWSEVLESKAEQSFGPLGLWGGSVIRPPLINSIDLKFKQWLVGFTDGFGWFNVVKLNQRNTYEFQFNIYQPIFNLRVLYYIKKQLGYGKVIILKLNQIACFRITNRKDLKIHIFPIFDKYPLLTSKYFAYLYFKKAYYISENLEFTDEGFVGSLGYKELENIINNKFENKKSQAILHLNENSKYEEIKSVLSENWLVGYIEAVGNYLIYPSVSVGSALQKSTKNKNYDGRCFAFEIEFKIVQPDEFILFLIKRLLHIRNNVKYNKDIDMYYLSTKNSRSILNIIKLYTNKFKGMKALEFKLWLKANRYKNHGAGAKNSKVHKIYKIVLSLQNKNLMLNEGCGSLRRGFNLLSHPYFVNQEIKLEKFMPGRYQPVLKKDNLVLD